MMTKDEGEGRADFDAVEREIRKLGEILSSVLC
jgi:hypothetical protein